NKSFWSDNSLEISGTPVFLEANQQPDTLSWTQHYRIKCDEKDCILEELILRSGKFIYSNLHKPEIININYPEKAASFKYSNCTIQIVNDSSTFTCDGKTSVLGDHLKLYYKQHSFFN